MKRASAGLGLAAFLAGVPVALMSSIGPPRLPSFAGSDGLSGTYVPVDAVLGLLGFLAWILWAYLAVAVLLSVAAELATTRGMPAGRALVAASRAFTPQAVRRLVELAVGGAFVAAALVGRVEPGGPVPGATTNATVNGTAPATVVRVAPADVQKATYRVRPGDSLWRIAERKLDSGFRWRKIFRLNRGKTFPDGSSLDDPNLIHPGWKLELNKGVKPDPPPLPEAEEVGNPAPSPTPIDVPSPTPVEIPSPALAEPVQIPSPVLADPAETPALVEVSPTPAEVPSSSLADPAETPAPQPTLGQVQESAEVEGAEPEPPPHRPVLRLPSDVVVAASFASGLLSAHLLGRLRRRRSRRPSMPEPVAPLEPLLPGDLRRAGASSMAGSLDVALDAVAQAWSATRQDWPPVLMAVEAERQVTVFVRDVDGVLPSTSGGSVSPLVRFSRAGEFVRAEVSGPFPPVLRPPGSPMQRGLVVPLGRVPDGTAVHAGLLASGPIAVTGQSAADLIRQMVIALSARGSPEDLQVILLGVPPDLQQLADLPQVTGVDTWDEAAEPLREIQAEFVRRARLFLEEGVENVWPHLAHHPEDRLPALLLVAGEPPNVMRGLVEGLAQEALKLGGVLIGVGWRPANAHLLADAESDGALRTNLPGADQLQPFLLPSQAAEEAIAIIQQAYPQEEVAQAEDDGDAPDSAGLPAPVGEQPPRLVEELTPGPVEEPPTSQTEKSPPIRVIDDAPEGPIQEKSDDLPMPGPPPGMVAVRCLGPLEVSRDGHPFRKGWRAKSLELLALLIANPSGASKDRIIEELWPEIDPRQASEIFYVVTSNIRRRLRSGDDPRPFVDREGETFRLQEGEWWVDAWEFERLVKEAEHDGDGEALETLRTAVAIYGGEFCAENYYPWADLAREHLRARFVEACARLADLLTDGGEQEEALSVLERAVNADPVCEDLWRRAMVIDASLGRRNAALARYRKLETILDKDLGVEPDPETQALARQLKMREADRRATG